MPSDTSKQWEVIKLVNAVHVIPLNDTSPHFETLECPCKASIEITRQKTLVVHNAWDWREYLKEGKNATKH
mgnify:CR=1 FL=1